MRNPPHPGRIVRQECIEALGLTVTAAAEGLGVTRKALSELINGKSGISPEMALRLAKAFGSSAEVWLGLQMDYDLAAVRRKSGRIKVRRLAPAALQVSLVVPSIRAADTWMPGSSPGMTGFLDADARAAANALRRAQGEAGC